MSKKIKYFFITICFAVLVLSITLLTGCSSKFDLSYLEDYQININGAVALGIAPQTQESEQTFSKITTFCNNDDLIDNTIKGLSPVFAKGAIQENEKNYIVMSTTYDSNNPYADASGLTKVSFTKTETKQVETEIIGAKQVFSKNNKLTFSAIEGFTYSVFKDGVEILSNVKDNDSVDTNKKNGVITLDSFKNKKYEIRYKGKGQEKTITQEEIEGEVDKLYVLGDYTFISFVPKGESKRPSPSQMEYGTDGVALYDKCDYFSDKNRQSFIIDNTTCYVYPIKDFNVKKIEGNLLLSADDDFIYDFKINENDEIEIFSLFQNDTIEWYSCFKDKYGNNYIQNNKMNRYDSATKTYFYVYFDSYEQEYYSTTIGKVNYELSENNEAIKIIFDEPNGNIIENVSVMQEDGKERKLVSEDNFKIYYRKGDDYVGSNRTCFIKVKNGILFGCKLNNVSDYGQLDVCQYGESRTTIDGEDCKYSCLTDSYSIPFVNTKFLEEYNIIIVLNGNKLVYCVDFWDLYEEVLKKNLLDNTTTTSGGIRIETVSLKEILENNEKILIENCTVENDKIIEYGILGNTYYDVIVEEIDGRVVVNKYISGTYQKPVKKVVILQPINKQ